MGKLYKGDNEGQRFDLMGKNGLRKEKGIYLCIMVGGGSEWVGRWINIRAD